MQALEIPPAVMARLREELPDVAAQTSAAVLAEVPGYSAVGAQLGAPIDEAVEIALRGFLNVLSRGSDPSAPHQRTLDAAYALGRGEARVGRTIDALLAAYRVGARVAWREQARISVAEGLDATSMSRFAELVFAYIDQLSAASVAGHAEETAASERANQRSLERLARHLLAASPADVLQASAQRAEWLPPVELCAVLLPGGSAGGIRARVDARSLQLSDDLPGLDSEEAVVLLVPLDSANDRDRLKRALAGRPAVLGPARPWMQAHVSYERALRVVRSGIRAATDEVVDADEHLVELVIRSDPDALADLSARVLSPLDGLRPATAAKLKETLRAWLLHQGRRDDVAAALFVHPQTVRYRMGQLRDLYGDRLDDPQTILAATVALGLRSA